MFCREQRITGFIIHLLIGLSTLITAVLRVRIILKPLSQEWPLYDSLTHSLYETPIGTTVVPYDFVQFRRF